MAPESVIGIQIWIINLHELNADFYKSFMMIEHSYQLSDFKNSSIMDIHGINDNSWCYLWNDKRITKIVDWIMEFPSSTEQGQVRLYIQLQMVF